MYCRCCYVIVVVARYRCCYRCCCINAVAVTLSLCYYCWCFKNQEYIYNNEPKNKKNTNLFLFRFVKIVIWSRGVTWHVPPSEFSRCLLITFRFPPEFSRYRTKFSFDYRSLDYFDSSAPSVTILSDRCTPRQKKTLQRSSLRQRINRSTTMRGYRYQRDYSSNNDEISPRYRRIYRYCCRSYCCILCCHLLHRCWNSYDSYSIHVQSVVVNIHLTKPCEGNYVYTCFLYFVFFVTTIATVAVETVVVTMVVTVYMIYRL